MRSRYNSICSVKCVQLVHVILFEDTGHISVGSALINNFVTTFYSKYSMDMLLPYKECMTNCLRIITLVFISFKQLCLDGCY